MEDSWVMVQERSHCTDVCSNSIVMLVSSQTTYVIVQERSHCTDVCSNSIVMLVSSQTTYVAIVWTVILCTYSKKQNLKHKLIIKLVHSSSVVKGLKTTVIPTINGSINELIN